MALGSRSTTGSCGRLGEDRGGDGKKRLLGTSPPLFGECAAHSTQDLLLKKQRPRDMGTANTTTTHRQRHAAIARGARFLHCHTYIRRELDMHLPLAIPDHMRGTLF
eukprot:scaffold4371_cov28-Phaeocystis_antarctica.AAC.1